MNWEDLRFFLEVVKSGSLKTAATSLKLSEVEVVSSISRLEKSLGSKLFEGEGEFMSLTDNGNQLFKSVISIEDEIKSTSMIFGKDKEIRNKIMIVKPDGLFSDWFMKSFRSLKDTYPTYDFVIKNSSEGLDINGYQADIEILLTNDPIHDIDKQITSDKITDIYSAPYIASELLENSDLFTALEELSWVRGWQDDHFIEWLENSGYDGMNIGWYVDGLKTQIDAVKFGLGVAFLPCSIADNVAGIERFSKDTAFKAVEMWFLSKPILQKDQKSKVISDYICNQVRSKYAIS